MADTNWVKGLPTSVGQFTTGFDLTLHTEPDVRLPYGLLVSQLASAEAYWDGNFLGTNGKIGETREAEVPGQLDYNFFIPPALLTPGKHRVEFRVSNFHTGKKVRFYGAYIDDYLGPMIRPLITTSVLHLYAGMFLVIGLFFGFRFLANRKDWALLIFTIICLAFFALLIMEYIRSYYLYPYPWHFTRLRIILSLSWLISAALPLFFALRLGLKPRWSAAAILAATFLVLLSNTKYGYDPATNWGMIAGFALATIVCLRGIWLGRNGAGLALVGVFPAAVALPLAYHHYDIVLYLGFGHLVVVVLISLVLKERQERELREEALLRSSRLKLQLLKKSIQPHFLMNSIASAIDWIEENPSRGVELLLALSEEFKLLLDSAEERLIPLERELALCRTHLTVMGFRKLTKYHLETDLELTATAIPPAIFLTLLENGISHQLPQNKAAGQRSFLLRQRVVSGQSQYRFLAPGEAAWPAEPPTKGTGLQYVEARLRESYGNAWKLDFGPVVDGWETVITVPVLGMDQV